MEGKYILSIGLWNNYLQYRNTWSPLWRLDSAAFVRARKHNMYQCPLKWQQRKAPAKGLMKFSFPSVSGQAEGSMGCLYRSYLKIITVSSWDPGTELWIEFRFLKTQSITFIQSNFLLSCWQANWKCDRWQTSWRGDRRLSDAVCKEGKNIHFSPTPNTHSYLSPSSCLYPALPEKAVSFLSWKSFQNQSSGTIEHRH